MPGKFQEPHGSSDKKKREPIIQETVRRPCAPSREKTQAPVQETVRRHVAFPSSEKQIDQYEIIEQIGAGGMGAVYKAKDVQMNRIVAIKVMLKASLGSESSIKRFKREIEISASLSHPNIVKVFHVGELDQMPYLVMEYIDGCPLLEYLERTPMPLKKKMALLEKIARAIDYAHQKKVIHRDIKPSNIMVRLDGEPVLMDFGLAKTTDVGDRSLTQSGEVIGTPHYMSPEQAHGIKKDIDSRTDIYALGAVMYHVLVGSPPAQGNTLMEVLRYVTYEKIEPPRTVHPEIPKIVEQICMKALEKNKEKRYAHASDFANDIKSYIKGRSTSASGFYRRRKWFTGLAKVGLVLFGLFLALGLYTIYRKYERGHETNQAMVQQEYLEAKRLIERKEYERAFPLLARVVENSDLVDACLQMGHVGQKLGKIREAKEALEKAFRLSPENPQVIYQKALFHASLREDGEALRGFDLYLAKRPEEAGAYRERAQVLRNLQRNEAADRDIRKANEIEEAALHQALSTIHKNASEKPDVALAQLDDLLQRHPAYEKGYVERAFLHHAQKNYAQAFQDISQAITINPTSDYYFLRGKWFYEAEYRQEAYESIKMALGKDRSKEDEMGRYLAELSEKLQKYGEAYQYCLSLYRKNKSPALELSLGRIAFLENKDGIALQYLNPIADSSLAAYSSVRGEALYYRGLVSQKQGRTEEAEKDWLRALEFQSSPRAEIQYRLGKVYVDRQHYETAMPYLAEASRILENRLEVHTLLGACCLQLSRFQEGVEVYSRCILLEPWEYDHYYNRGICLTEIGRFEESEKDFEVCLKLKPERLSAYVRMVDNLFQSRSLLNYQKLCLVIQVLQRTPRYAIEHALQFDLFEKEKLPLQKSLRISQEEYEKRQNAQKWDEKKATVFLKGITESDSPEAHRLAQNVLLSMREDPRLYAFVERERQKELPSSVQNRLEELLRSIVEDHLPDFRKFLIRYYFIRENEVLKKIYERHNLGIQCLWSLLNDESENIFIRFWAAKALGDLRTEEADEKICAYEQAENLTAKLFCYVVGCAQGLLSFDARVYRLLSRTQHPYARAISVQCVPLIQASLLKDFLRDGDSRVRLYAAQKLRMAGDPEGLKELTEGLSSPSSHIKAFCTSSYWDFQFADAGSRKVLKGKAAERIQELMKLSEDADDDVRRTALIRAVQWSDTEYEAIISKCLKDDDILVRMQALLSLTERKDMKLIMPVLLDSKESFINRSLAAISMYGVTKSVYDILPYAMSMLEKIKSDPNPKFRYLMFFTLGWIKYDFLANLLLKHSYDPDEMTRLGCVSGMSNNGSVKFLPRLKEMFADPSPLIRSGAALSYIFIVGKHHPEKLESLSRQFKEKSEEIRVGAYLGYVFLTQHTLIMENQYSPEDTKSSTSWEHLYELFVANFVKSSKLLSWDVRNTGKKGITSLKEYLDYFSWALSLYEKNEYSWFERAILYYLASEKVPDQQADFYKRGISDLETAVGLNGKKYVFKKWLAFFYMKNGVHQVVDYPKAHSLLSQLIQESPWDEQLWEWKSNVLSELGEKNESSACSRRASYLQKRKK